MFEGETQFVDMIYLKKNINPSEKDIKNKMK